MQTILQKLSGFKISHISIEKNCVNLHVQLEKGQNADTQETMIRNLLSEYNVQVTFIMKNDAQPIFKKIIGVSSGKGGVGKTTIALHLAFCLKELGYSVGILDADIYTPSMPTLLGTFENPISIDGRTIEPIKTAHGFELLSMGLFLQENQAPLWRESILTSAFCQFLEQGHWQCEYLIIDLPPGTNDIHINLAKIAPQTEILLVTEPSKIAYADLKKMYVTTRALNLRILGLVENRAYWHCKNCGQKKHMQTKAAALLENGDISTIIKLPIFHHIHELMENGYPADYKMQAEAEYFKEIAQCVTST